MILWDWFKAADPARFITVRVGYKVQEVQTVIRLRPDGSVVHWNILPEPIEVEVPHSPKGSGVVTDVIDSYDYALGASPAGRPFAFAAARHKAYREHLESFEHPATRAILAFLDRRDRPVLVPVGAALPMETQVAIRDAALTEGPVPMGPALKASPKKPEWFGHWACTLNSAIKHHPGPAGMVEFVADNPKGLVLFEVEGYPAWWLDSVFVNAKSAARQADQGGTVGLCSLCFQHKALARKIDPTAISKGPLLLSFNLAAFTAFGREQSLTAPTCQDCAESMVRGFNAILGPAEKMHPAKTYHSAIWWEGTLQQDLWSIFDRVFDLELPEAERYAALRELPEESYFLSIRRNERRLAFRRHAYVRREALAARLSRAIAAGFSFNHVVDVLRWGAKRDDAAGKRRSEGDEEKRLSTIWREALLIDLIGGEPLSLREQNAIRRLAGNRDLNRYQIQHLTSLVTYLGVDMRRREPTTDEERSCYALGQALAHLDRVQYKQNKAAVPHSTRLLKQSVINALRVRAGLRDLATVRRYVRADGAMRLVADKDVVRFYAEASYLPNRRMNDLEANFLQDGFHNEREHIFTFRSRTGETEIDDDSDSAATAAK